MSNRIRQEKIPQDVRKGTMAVVAGLIVFVVFLDFIGFDSILTWIFRAAGLFALLAAGYFAYLRLKD